MAAGTATTVVSGVGVVDLAGHEVRPFTEQLHNGSAVPDTTGRRWWR